MKRDGLEQPEGLSPALVVHLKPGWSCECESGRFVSDDGSVIDAFEDLPARSKIVATVPDLANRRIADMDADEARLARSFQVILPQDVDLAEIRSRVDRWDCVGSSEVAPIPEPPAGRVSGVAPGALPGSPEEE